MEQCPDICIMCKNYYCTSTQYTPEETKDHYKHRCKGKLIVTFNYINGKIDQNDEYCYNVNTNGKCQYYYKKKRITLPRRIYETSKDSS